MSAQVSYFSVRRIWVLAHASLTQLVRMKVLWFLLIFSLLLAGLGVVSASMSSSPVQQLTTLKSVTLFVMGIFAELLAIAATAVLIPRDIEDRTLYTILCRPVPRIEYLLGKFLGILALLLLCLGVMDLLLNGLLFLRQGQVIEQQLQVYMNMGLSESELADQRQRLQGLGISWGLQGAVLTIFMRAAVMAALTLLLSTLATSTLFTQITAVSCYLVGHLSALARAEAIAGDGWITRTLTGVVALIFPDLQMFNMNDAVISGEMIGWGMMTKMAAMCLLYVGAYVLLAWLVFADREY